MKLYYMKDYTKEIRGNIVVFPNGKVVFQWVEYGGIAIYDSLDDLKDQVNIRYEYVFEEAK